MWTSTIKSVKSTHSLPLYFSSVWILRESLNSHIFRRHWQIHYQLNTNIVSLLHQIYFTSIAIIFVNLKRNSWPWFREYRFKSSNFLCPQVMGFLLRCLQMNCGTSVHYVYMCFFFSNYINSYSRLIFISYYMCCPNLMKFTLHDAFALVLKLTLIYDLRSSY